MCSNAALEKRPRKAKMLPMQIPAFALLLALCVSVNAQTVAPGPFAVPPYQPIFYTNLWSSSDGNTHIADCTVQTLPLQSYVGGVGGSQADNYLGVLANSTSTIFVQMIVGQYTPPHNAPVSQFVTVSSGNWYIETSDGEGRIFEAGDILFQDNTANSPAAVFPNLAKHISGQVGDQPCNFVVTQVNFNPTVDQPCPF
ncbi:TPA: hypothetical protein ACH3X3_003150 [Trebouxia sp. C0006]